MAELDNTGTVSMLERMKEKVEQEEALAEAYGDIAKKPNSIDEEINLITKDSKTSSEDALKKLKEQLNKK
jgi:phage shock protein A